VVLTKGGTLSPLSTAFFARSPAPIIAAGLEVWVQEVIEARTMLPAPRTALRPSIMTGKVAV